jgi:PadR family transcriptional regulator PadR
MEPASGSHQKQGGPQLRGVYMKDHKDADHFDLSPQEEIILTLLVGREFYGLGLMKAIEEASKGKLRMKFGSLYPTLHRLEKKGFVTSRWGADRPEERGHARRRYYTMTGLGEKVLQEAQQLRANLVAWQPAWGRA